MSGGKLREKTVWNYIKPGRPYKIKKIIKKNNKKKLNPKHKVLKKSLNSNVKAFIRIFFSTNIKALAVLKTFF